MKNIAFIGLGHMGTPMVTNLLNAGYNVMVYDIVPESVDILVARGALAAKSFADLAEHAECIFTSVQTGEQVTDIMQSEDGLFHHAKENTLFIDLSSIDITTCRTLHAKAKQSGFRMLDAPVSGGVAGAEAASLTIMAGG